MSAIPLLIINPNSQGGKTGSVAAEIVRVLQRHVGDVDTHFTSAPRDAVSAAEQAARDGRTTVIAVGGDGTIHEVVNGLMRARADGLTPPTLGIVGQGTGGDFRKTLGLKHRLDRYCQTIAGGHSRAVDVGAFRYRNRSDEPAEAYFINILSVGMGGLVDEYVSKSDRKLGGTLAYLGASFRALVESEVGILQCVLHDGDEAREVEIATRTIAICNGQYFGGGMQVAPMASLEDGYFDVVSLGSAGKVKFALGSMAIYSGKHIDNPEVQVFRCQRIEIDLKNSAVRDSFLLDVDGEPLGKLPIDIRVEAKAIEVFVDDA